MSASTRSGLLAMALGHAEGERNAAVARAERAEAVVRLLVETRGAPLKGDYGWSRWRDRPDLLAALRDITGEAP